MLCSNRGEEKPLLLHLLTWPEMYGYASSAASKETVFKGSH